jgi:hypothetical protein
VVYIIAPPNNGMHPTADTTALMLRERLGAAGDAWRWAASYYGYAGEKEISLSYLRRYRLADNWGVLGEVLCLLPL